MRGPVMEGTSPARRWTPIALALLALASCIPVPNDEVDDSSAAASVLAPAPLWNAFGSQTTSAFGASLAFPGDVDGDGDPELAVGAPAADLGQRDEGAVFVFDGGPYGPSSSPVLTVEGNQPRANLGSSVAPAGDVDGDGYADLLVGVPGWDQPPMGEPGRVQLHLGGADGLDPDPAWTAVGDSVGARLGSAVAGVGDLDGAGWADLAASAPARTDLGPGRVYVWFGGADGPGERWSWGPEQPGATAGASLASGDVNGDGYADLAVGLPGFDGPPEDVGAVALFLGGPFGPAPAPDWLATGSAAGGQMGSSLSLASDLDGDGFCDLAAGIPGLEPAGAGGRVAVWAGGPIGPSGAASWLLEVPRSGGRFGEVLAGVGDLDGDGFDELVVSAPLSGLDTALAGAVYVFRGGADGPAASPSTRLGGPSVHGRFGAALAGADADDDGVADLAIGAPNSAPSDSGRAQLFQGLGAEVDADGDGWCATGGGCGAGMSEGDCDDDEPTVHPGAEELCDGQDTDCDGQLPADEVDADGDGWLVCGQDCAGQDPSVHPGAAEVCNGLDDDCDGEVDNGDDAKPFWPDQDGDGHGDPEGEPAWSCEDAVPGHAPDPHDCDDSDAAVSPSAFEQACNELDDDCNPSTGDLTDLDGDAWTPCDCEDGNLWIACGDCDDLDGLVNPAMSETCGDGVDQDCDGVDPACATPPVCDEPDLDCSPRGCSTAGPAGGSLVGLLLLAWLPLLRRRATAAALLAAGLLLASGSARAGDLDLDTQLLRPSFAPWGWLSTPGAHPGLAGSFRSGVVVQYEHVPLVLLIQGQERDWLVGPRLSFSPGGFWVPWDRVGFGFSIPIYAQAGAWNGRSLNGAAVGDLRGEVCLLAVDTPRFRLGVTTEFYLPTSTRGAFVGEEKPRFEPGVAAQVALGPVTSLVALAVLLREPVHTGYDLDLTVELSLVAGLRVWPKPGKLAVQLELESRTAADAFMVEAGERPAELRLGLRAYPHDVFQVDLAGGVGLNSGYGAPMFRVLLGLAFRRLPWDRPEPEVWYWRPGEEDFEQPVAGKAWDHGIEDAPRRVAPETADPGSGRGAGGGADDLYGEPGDGPLVVRVGDRLVLSRPIEFEHDSDVLLPSAPPLLEAVADLLDSTPLIAHVLVEGHASVEGTVTYNWELSCRRAASVFRYLVEAGVSADRLSFRGMGEAEGARSARGGAIEPEDRRVEFHIVRELSEWVDQVPDWSADAPPIPWTMEEAEEDSEQEGGAP